MELHLLIIILFIFISHSDAVKLSNPQNRFHHGSKVNTRDIFFAPMLRKPRFSEFEYVCGGTWIHDKFALTTAYCLKQHEGINYVGILGSDNSWLGDNWKIKFKFYFQNYTNEGINWFNNDIGLVMAQNKNYGLLVLYPTFIPNNWNDLLDFNNYPTVMYGFGRTEDETYATHLKYMVGRPHFGDSYVQRQCNITSVHEQRAFCLEPKEFIDRIDNGDMGNPVYYNVKDPANFKPYDRILIGIVSYYYLYPNNIIIMNVSHYQNFIEETIEKNKFKDI